MTVKEPLGVRVNTTESKTKRSPFLRQIIQAYNNILSKLSNFEKEEMAEFRKSFGKFGPHVGLVIVFAFVFISNIISAYANNEPVKSIVLASVEKKEVKNFTQGVNKYSKSQVAEADINTLTYNLTQEEYQNAPETTGTNKTADVELKKQPEVPVVRTANVTYTVQSGDTLSGLAKKFNLKISTIQSLNKIGSNGLIKPGQSLTIPAKDLTSTQLAQNSRNRYVASAQASERVVRNNGSNGSGTVEYVSRSSGQCVPWAREYSGKAIYGWARNIMPNSQDPAVGGVLLTNESSAGHVAVVVGVGDDSIQVMERNYVSGWITKRTIPKNSRVIRGYFN